MAVLSSLASAVSQFLPKRPNNQTNTNQSSQRIQRNTPQPPSAAKPPSQMTWQELLPYYQQNPAEGQKELKRAEDKLRLYQALGQQDNAQRAQRWINQVKTVMGIPTDPNVARFQEYQRQQQEFFNRLQNMMNQPFEYDPEDDPRYQAYRELAQARARDASRAAMEELNARGILNSSITANQLAQIQQAAEQEALSAIPAFYEQAARQRQQDIANLYNVIGMLSDEAQRVLDNQFREQQAQFERDAWSQEFRENQRLANIANALRLTELFGTPVQPKMGGQELFNQVMGRLTLPAQQQRFEQDYANRRFAAEREDELAARADRRRGLDLEAGRLALAREQFDFERSQAQRQGQVDINDIIREIDSSHYVDRETGEVLDRFGLEAYILSIPGLTDEQYERLYRRYGLPLSQ